VIVTEAVAAARGLAAPEEAARVPTTLGRPDAAVIADVPESPAG
jgi:hypothetical protein